METQVRPKPCFPSGPGRVAVAGAPKGNGDISFTIPQRIKSACCGSRCAERQWRRPAGVDGGPRLFSCGSRCAERQWRHTPKASCLPRATRCGSRCAERQWRLKTVLPVGRAKLVAVAGAPKGNGDLSTSPMSGAMSCCGSRCAERQWRLLLQMRVVLNHVLR